MTTTTTTTTTTILLVEDDDNDVFFFQHALDKAGTSTALQVARDGQEAIDYLRGGGKFAERAKFPQPGLILLDLKLPFVMGLDVLKWIRQESNLSPIVVILSSSGQQEDVEAAYQLGANAYLVKPADMGKLEVMVRAINDFWLIQNTAPSRSRAARDLQTQANARAEGLRWHRPPSVSSALAQAPSKISRCDL
jgi:DNA-binding response OmpR family regulator